MYNKTREKIRKTSVCHLTEDQQIRVAINNNNRGLIGLKETYLVKVMKDLRRNNADERFCSDINQRK